MGAAVELGTMQQTILLVEDERAVARGLEYALHNEGYTVLWAQTGQSALDLARTKAPHLIVLDIRLPDLSGFDVCRTLRGEGKRQPILMLTARDEEMDKVLGLELGADDYVVKPYGVRELLSRIRALLRRAYGDLAQPAASAPLRYGPLELDPQRMVATLNGEPLELTPIEYRLLHHFLCNPEQPFTRSQLIEQVWGYASEVEAERTVDVHIRHLRQKIEADPGAPRWLVTVRGAGYKLGEG
ncbi:MAG: response regulator transcription factor [Caldilineaceae bacterium]|nr:response regulator transcription factor [Caldilineaceae bacterium]